MKRLPDDLVTDLCLFASAIVALLTINGVVALFYGR